MAAGIDSGAISTSTTYDDTGCITVSNAKICNYDLKARGVIPVQQILDQSLNVGASWVATHTGYPTFTQYMKAYGFNEKTGIDLPSEITGTLTESRRRAGAGGQLRHRIIWAGHHRDADRNDPRLVRTCQQRPIARSARGDRDPI